MAPSDARNQPACKATHITYRHHAKLSILHSGMTLVPPPFPCPINRTTLKGGQSIAVTFSLQHFLVSSHVIMWLSLRLLGLEVSSYMSYTASFQSLIRGPFSSLRRCLKPVTLSPGLLGDHPCSCFDASYPAELGNGAA